MESGFYANDQKLLVVFGGKIGLSVGDITISYDNGLDDTYQILGLRQCEKKHNIGDNIANKEPIAEQQIVLCFNNAAQVDVLIENLKRVKSRLKDTLND